ncbi:hypothetical protein MUK42_36476 [Musa troglodytarum]|uniref:Uncharacterized protein n=1 Tax=Musa troglodytarum TaxID=320322 RepID=A0A9E7FNU8_9LILI|nr:hypothetical protein MUK42_36476 [Musa troglodytarum]
MMYRLSWWTHMLGRDTSKKNTAATESIPFVPANMIRCVGPRHQRAVLW